MAHDQTLAAVHPPKGDEIDLMELLSFLWEKRRLILVSSIVTLGLSAIYGYKIAKPVFESSVLLLPTQTPASDQLGAAAALLGRKASSGNADVDLYQSLLTSRTVIGKLLDAPIVDQSDSGKGKIKPLFQVLQIDMTNPGKLEDEINSLSKSVNVGTKPGGEGGILEIKFGASSPWLAQQIGKNLLSIGQEELRQIRVRRAETILPRLAAAVSQAKGDWDSSARVLTMYKDRNRSITLPEQGLQLSRLMMELQVQEQKYLQTRREYESQVLEREKATPPMMILDPPSCPARKSKPNRLAILAVGFLSGFIGSCLILVANKTINRSV